MFKKKPTPKAKPKEAVSVATSEPCKETINTKVVPTFRFRLKNGALQITEASSLGEFYDDECMLGMSYRYNTNLSRSDAKVLFEFLLENRSELV